MKKFVLGLVCLFAIANMGEARGWRRSYSQVNSVNYSIDPKDVKTAEGVAKIMARLGRVGQFGGVFQFEGCGSGTTYQEAYYNCCFSNDPNLVTVDYGYAQDSSGIYYCCRRYVPRN